MKPRIRKFRGRRYLYGVFVGDAYVVGTAAGTAPGAWWWYDIQVCTGSIQLAHGWYWDKE